MLEIANGKAMPKFRLVGYESTPQARRSEYCRVALHCLKDGHKIAAELLYERAAIENTYAMSVKL